MLLLAVVTRLPFSLPPVESTAVATQPILTILGMLTIGAGLPFFALAATSPLLQLWLSRTDTRAAKNPYPLYAASNLGSLLGLVAYPLVIEPFAGLRVQGLVWALAFAGFVALLAVAFRFSWVRRAPAVPTVDANARPEAISVMRRARWVALAFVPSSVMLGMTANVSTAIAPMPLLWTFPLALYLLTFVIAFSERTRGVRFTMLKAAPFAVLAVTLLLAWHDTLPVVPFVLLHLAVVFLLSLACHGAVADDKPSIDVGLSQVNSANFPSYKVTAADMLEPCANLRIGSTILANAYRSSTANYKDPREALIHAIMAYNTGSFLIGASYVQAVVEMALEGAGPTVPSIASLRGSVPTPRQVSPIKVAIRNAGTMEKRGSETTPTSAPLLAVGIGSSGGDSLPNTLKPVVSR